MGLFDQQLHLFARQAGHRDGQLGLDPETGGQRTDADLAGDRGVGGQGLLLLGGHELQRTQEAGGIAGGKQLFRVGALAASAAQLAGRGQAYGQTAVVGAGAALTAAGGGGGGGVEDLVEAHGSVLVWEGVPLGQG